ncbi:MAG: peptidoglycan DD-metalloendopeptidase family protein [Peptostreptococcales bacterium]
MKKVVACICIIMLMSTLPISHTFGGVEETQQELDGITKKLDGIKDLLTQGEKKEKSIVEQITDLDNQIEKKENELKVLEAEIRDTQKQINTCIENLNQKQKEIDDRNELLNSRLVVMYKNGDVGLLQILLDSSDFREFMNNLEMAKRIYAHDVELLKGLKEKHQELTAAKEKLDQLKYALHQQKSNVVSKQESLEVSRGQAVNLRQKVKEDNKALEQQIDSLNDYAKELAEIIRKAQSDSDYVGGVFAWPCPGYKTITSPFGNRLHPILKVNKLHTGTDFRVPSNSTIVAVNDGVVIHSNWLGGYGKTVMIDHGGGIVTLYAHNNSLTVSLGEKVKKGQTIAKSGSTGQSTGPHLHFEVRVNGEYVDPMPYLK